MTRSSFFDKYEELISTNSLTEKFENFTHKICKFCLRNSNQTKFQNIPHVLPELFGKNNYTSNDECDDCNKLFSTYENDLANFLSPYQTLVGQKTKKKIPIFQSRKKSNEKSTILISENGIPIFNFNNNIGDFQYDYLKKRFQFNAKKKKFIPINAYKSFVKIGLSLCPSNELSDFSKATAWILSNNTEKITFDIPFTLYRTRLTSKFYEKPFAALYRRKFEVSSNIYEPKLCLIVCSGVLVFQVFIPFCIETEKINTKNYNLVNELYPAFLFNIDFEGSEKKIVKTKELPIIQYDMNCYAKVEEDEIIQFSYNKLIKK